jgi:hypothetical protein
VRPEERLLVLLARGSLDPAMAERARALMGANLDWSAIVDLSDAHGVTPFVARNLAAMGDAGIPEPARRALERARRMNAARSALAARLLRQVLRALGDAGVPVIPLKGVALGQWLYGDPSLRVSSDVDILVPRRDAIRAVRLLVALGYSPAPGEPDVGPEDLDLLLDSNIEYGFLSPAWSACPVELHWDMAWRWPRAASALADLWSASRPARFADVEARRPSPEWELLYLAVHAARHRWQRLKWLVDVHEICARGEVRWAAARDTAGRFGLEAVLGIALGACRQVLETPLPAGAPAHPVPPWLALFPADAGSPGPWREAAYPARLLARPSDKLAYLARVLFLPTLAERRLVRLPAALGPLYYPLRPLRLAGRLGRDLVRAGLAGARRQGRIGKHLDTFPPSGRSSGLGTQPDEASTARRSTQESV